MQRRTLSRFDEILKVFRKYDFDKFLGQTTRKKISPFRSDADNCPRRCQASPAATAGGRRRRCPEAGWTARRCGRSARW